MNKNLVVVLSLALLVGLFGAGAWYYRAEKTQAVVTQSADHSELYEPAASMRYGNPDARVAIVEFYDPACETCAQFSPLVRQMVDDSGGKVRLVLRYAPFHPGSDQLALLVEASRKQDKYWTTLETLFATQKAWADHHNPRHELIWDFLEQAGVDTARLAEDMKDPAVLAVVQQDTADARKIGVQATPEFFVDGKPLPSWGLPQLQALVAAEVAANY